MAEKVAKKTKERGAHETVKKTLGGTEAVPFQRPGAAFIVRAAEDLGYTRGQVPLGDGMDVVFVYGTLQPGWFLHNRIGAHVASYEPLGVLSGYRMYAYGYPWITKSAGEKKVWGTLLFLTAADTALETMDMVELGAGYTRIKVDVATPSGDVSAWAYVWGDKEFVPWTEDAVVESGDFAVFDGGD